MMRINPNFSMPSFKGLLVYKNEYDTTAINTDFIKSVDSYSLRGNENKTYTLNTGYESVMVRDVNQGEFESALSRAKMSPSSVGYVESNTYKAQQKKEKQIKESLGELEKFNNNYFDTIEKNVLKNKLSFKGRIVNATCGKNPHSVVDTKDIRYIEMGSESARIHANSGFYYFTSVNPKDVIEAYQKAAMSDDITVVVEPSDSYKEWAENMKESTMLQAALNTAQFCLEHNIEPVAPDKYKGTYIEQYYNAIASEIKMKNETEENENSKCSHSTTSNIEPQNTVTKNSQPEFSNDLIVQIKDGAARQWLRHEGLDEIKNIQKSKVPGVKLFIEDRKDGPYFNFTTDNMKKANQKYHGEYIGYSDYKSRLQHKIDSARVVDVFNKGILDKIEWFDLMAQDALNSKTKVDTRSIKEQLNDLF